jgi:hypothetical protein
MIDLVLLLSAQALSVIPSDPIEVEAQILSEKLASGGFQTDYDTNWRLISCKIVKSTGDVELDASVCQIAEACNEAHIERSAVRHCENVKQEEFFRELARRRTSATQGHDEPTLPVSTQREPNAAD